MPTFSLDTNCIVDIDEARPNAVFVKEILQAHRDGRANVALAAISASERQKSGTPLQQFEEFKARLTKLGLDGLELLKPMAYWGVTFWGQSDWAEANPVAPNLESKIHEILFPDIPFLWQDFCRKHGLDPVADFKTESARVWKNAKCDVQALWSHASRGRDVFVTSDGNFHKATKKPGLITLIGSRIETPESAAVLLHTVTP